MEQDIKHLHEVIRHIEKVKDNCHRLAEKLVERDGEGDFDLAKELVARSYLHDNSKFYGIEWKQLRKDADIKDPLFIAAHEQHVTTNRHHPEAWDDIKDMTNADVAEFVCDILTRSHEFGTDIRQWIKEVATEKYGFSLKGPVYKKIKEYVDMLVDQPFKQVKK